MSFVSASTLIRVSSTCTALRKLAIAEVSHDSEWRDSGAFVYFRLTPSDLDDIVAWESDTALIHDGDGLYWLHNTTGIDVHYGSMSMRHKCNIDLHDLGLRTRDTLWAGDMMTDWMTFTRHLQLHPRLGRPRVQIDDLITHIESSRAHDWQASDLAAWLRDAGATDLARLHADARAGVDAAAALSRFTREPVHALYAPRLRYGIKRGERLPDWEVQRMMERLPLPAWQRPPTTPRPDLNFLDRETLHDPNDIDAKRYVYRHTSVAGRDGCFFRCSLSFFDAIEQLVATRT